MNYLFNCSNPYQIMLAGVLKGQIASAEDTVDMMITDTFNGYETIANRVKESGYFNDVYTIKVKDIIVPKDIRGKIKKIKNLLFYTALIKSVHIDTKNYDALYFNNEDIFTFNLITCVKRNNPSCKICRFEEGYSSYTNLESSSRKSKQIISWRNRLFVNYIDLKWDEFYVFEPSMLMKEYDAEIITIKRSEAKNEDYIAFVETVFRTAEVLSSYNKKNIIFEESFVHDGFEVDDIELYKKLIQIVGETNVMVKLHPRSKTNRFSDMNINVQLPNGIPWEAILLTARMESITLLALGSGSVINSRLLLGTSARAILLYKCLNTRPPAFDSNFELFIRRFSEKYQDGVFVPETIDEAIKIIRE